MKYRALIYAVASLLLFSSSAWAMGERPSVSSWCGSLFKMEETLLYIPPELKPRFSVRYDGKFLKSFPCYNEGVAPIKATDFSMFPYIHFSDFFADGKRDEIGRGLALWVRATAYKEKQEDEFSRLKTQYEIDVKKLLKESGFYVLQGKKPYQKFFISEQSILKTAKGNPVVFSCYETSTKYCEVLLVRNNVVFGISQINRFHVPMQDWPKLYKRFESLVELLVVENEGRIHTKQQGDDK